MLQQLCRKSGVLSYSCRVVSISTILFFRSLPITFLVKLLLDVFLHYSVLWWFPQLFDQAVKPFLQLDFAEEFFFSLSKNKFCTWVAPASLVILRMFHQPLQNFSHSGESILYAIVNLVVSYSSSVAQKNYRANVPFVQDKESVISRKQSPKTQR